jgi:hypothetical protein
MIDDVFLHFEGHQLMSFREIFKANFTNIEVAITVRVDLGAQGVAPCSAEVAIATTIEDATSMSLQRVRVEAGAFGAGRFATVCAKQHLLVRLTALRTDRTAKTFVLAEVADRVDRLVIKSPTVKSA